MLVMDVLQLAQLRIILLVMDNPVHAILIIIFMSIWLDLKLMHISATPFDLYLVLPPLYQCFIYIILIGQDLSHLLTLQPSHNLNCLIIQTTNWYLPTLLAKLFKDRQLDLM